MSEPDNNQDVLDRLTNLLGSIHPHLPAAIGHAMCFVVEDGAADKVLVDDDLDDASRAFYDYARIFADMHTNYVD